MATLNNADPADRAEVYAQLGLHLTYQPERRVVTAEVRPTDPCTKVLSERGLEPADGPHEPGYDANSRLNRARLESVGPCFRHSVPTVVHQTARTPGTQRLILDRGITSDRYTTSPDVT